MTFLKRLLAALALVSLAAPAAAQISGYSTTAASNTTVGGISVAEGTAPGNLNDAIRAVMADLASFYSGNGTKFTGNATIGDASGDTLTITGTAVATPNGLNFDSGLLQVDATNNVVGINATPVSGVPLRVQSTTSNSGLEVLTSGTGATLFAYDRATPVEITLTTRGSALIYDIAGGEKGRWDTNGYLLVNYTSSNGAYPLQVNGQIFATSATIATSDGRVKENVAALGPATDVLMALAPVSYTFKANETHNFPQGTQVGFIAQDAAAALQGNPAKGAIVAEPANEGELWGLAEVKLIPFLVKAFQEQQVEIVSLKARVAALEAQ